MDYSLPGTRILKAQFSPLPDAIYSSEARCVAELTKYSVQILVTGRPLIIAKTNRNFARQELRQSILTNKVIARLNVPPPCWPRHTRPPISPSCCKTLRRANREHGHDKQSLKRFDKPRPRYEQVQKTATALLCCSRSSDLQSPKIIS